jgi:hypothetical protein
MTVEPSVLPLGAHAFLLVVIAWRRRRRPASGFPVTKSAWPEGRGVVPCVVSGATLYTYLVFWVLLLALGFAGGQRGLSCVAC